MKTEANISRSVLVTGAGNPTGIGFAGAKALGLLGYRVGITSTTDRVWDRVKELEALGIETFGFVALIKIKSSISSK